MSPHPGQQITINSRPGVILSTHEVEGLIAVTIFWPGTSSPPMISGARRPGDWNTKTRVLLYQPDSRHWFWDVGGRALVTENHDERSFINLPAWLQAFARALRPHAVAT